MALYIVYIAVVIIGRYIHSKTRTTEPYYSVQVLHTFSNMYIVIRKCERFNKKIQKNTLKRELRTEKNHFCINDYVWYRFETFLGKKRAFYLNIFIMWESESKKIHIPNSIKQQEIDIINFKEHKIIVLPVIL